MSSRKEAAPDNHRRSLKGSIARKLAISAVAFCVALAGQATAAFASSSSPALDKPAAVKAASSGKSQAKRSYRGYIYHFAWDNTVHVAVGEKRKLSIRYETWDKPEKKIVAKLQERVNKKWKNRGKITLKRAFGKYKKDSHGSFAYTGNFPVQKKKGIKKFRLVFDRTDKYDKYVTKPFKVYVIDQRSKRKKQVLKDARKAIAKYCKGAKIYLDGKDLKEHRAAGLAYHYPTQDYFVMRSDMSAKSTKRVARHECAHLIQFKNYYLHGNAYEYHKKAAKVYGVSEELGIEYAADCMVAYWSKSTKGSSYTKDCKGKKLKFAKKTFKGTALSKKYNPPKK